MATRLNHAVSIPRCATRNKGCLTSPSWRPSQGKVALMERLHLLFQDGDSTAVLEYIGGHRAPGSARGLGAQRCHDLGFRRAIALRQP